METLDRELMMQSLQWARPKEEYQLSDNAEGVDLKKELPEQKYFTLKKLRTYDCELKVE